MQLGVFEKNEIRKYFMLDKKIEKKYKRLDIRCDSFYSQNMFLHTEYPSQEDIDAKNNSNLRVRGFSIEHNISKYIDSRRFTLKLIKMLKDKQRYLNDYLNKLDVCEREYLLKKYSCKETKGKTIQADIDLYAEILEINEAINFKYGYPPDEEDKFIITDQNNFLEDFKAIAEMLKV